MGGVHFRKPISLFAAGKGMFASVWLSKRIHCACRDMIAHRVRVVARVYVGGKIHSDDYDHHKQSISGCG